MFTSVSCTDFEVFEEDNSYDEFMGEWKLVEMAKVDSLGNKDYLPLPNEYNVINAFPNNKFSAVLHLIDEDNPVKKGTWERTDEVVVSLMMEHPSKNDKNDIFILHKEGYSYVLNVKVYYHNDSVNFFRFSK